MTDVNKHLILQSWYIDAMHGICRSVTRQIAMAPKINRHSVIVGQMGKCDPFQSSIAQSILN